jgi:beta-carotene hydroxylase
MNNDQLAGRNSIERLPDLSQLGSGLVAVSAAQRIRSLLLPILGFVAYVLFASAGYWPLAVLATMFVSFVTYGSISHDLVHRTLGLSGRMNDVFLSLIELLAVRSGHAYQAAHLHHHARFPHDDDVEGSAARMSLSRTLLEGIIFQYRIYFWALKHAKHKRAWITFEGASCVAVVIVAVLAYPVTIVPVAYVGLMVAGTWIIPLITSYIPHDAKATDALHQTRAFRGRVASIVGLEHLYHLEHHLYPGVPHHHWPTLARRLDPYLEAAGIQPVKLWF